MLKERNIEIINLLESFKRIAKKGMFPLAFSATLLSGYVAGTNNKTNSNNTSKYEASDFSANSAESNNFQSNDFEPNNFKSKNDEGNNYVQNIDEEVYENAVKTRPEGQGENIFSEVIGQTVMKVILYENTYYLNIANSSIKYREYQITEEEFLSIEREYQKFKNNLNKEDQEEVATKYISKTLNFDFSINVYDIKSKEDIYQEIGYFNSNDNYPDTYIEYIDSSIKSLLATGKITKHFSIYPLSYDEHLDFFTGQLKANNVTNENTVPQYKDGACYLSAETSDQKISFSTNPEYLIIEKKPNNSNVSESTYLGDIIITVYKPSVGGTEEYFTNLKTGAVARTTFGDEEQIESFNPNTKKVVTKDKKTIFAPENYKEYQYHNFNIAFSTVPDGNYIYVFNQETKKLLWRQSMDLNQLKSLESQISKNPKKIKFTLNDNNPDTLIGFQVPEKNFSSEDYEILKKSIIEDLYLEKINATVEITNNTFETKIDSESKSYNIGQTYSEGSQCFYYEKNDGIYSIEYKILEDHCEIWYTGPDLSWTILDYGPSINNGTGNIKFRDNLDERKIQIDVEYYNPELGEIILQKSENEIRIFPGVYLNNKARTREK